MFYSTKGIISLFIGTKMCVQILNNDSIHLYIQLTRIQAAFLKVLHGYPPQRMDLTNSQVTVSSLGVSSGDTLIVEEDCSLVQTGEVRIVINL